MPSIVIVGMPGSGKTWAASKISKIVGKPSGLSVASVGGIRSRAKIRTAAWNSGRMVTRALTYSNSGKVAFVGDFTDASGSTDIDVGFEARGAFRSEYNRRANLDKVIATVPNDHVLVTEGLQLSEKSVRALAKRTRSRSARKCFVLTTCNRLAEGRYLKRVDAINGYVAAGRAKREKILATALRIIEGCGFEMIYRSSDQVVDEVSKILKNIT